VASVTSDIVSGLFVDVTMMHIVCCLLPCMLQLYCHG